MEQKKRGGRYQHFCPSHLKTREGMKYGGQPKERTVGFFFAKSSDKRSSMHGYKSAKGSSSSCRSRSVATCRSSMSPVSGKNPSVRALGSRRPGSAALLTTRNRRPRMKPMPNRQSTTPTPMPMTNPIVIPNKVKDVSCPGGEDDVDGSTGFAAQSSSPHGDVSDTLAPSSWGMRHVSGTANACDEDGDVCSRNLTLFSVTMMSRVRLAMHTAAATAVSLLSLSSARSNDMLTGA